MPLQAKAIFDRLNQWPHRGVGSEEEMEARETLITILTGEHGVDIAEEGFDAPPSYLRFFWLTGLIACAAVMGANLMPAIMMLLGSLGFISFFLFMDWRVSPLIWWGAQKTTANLVASKGQNNPGQKGQVQRLFILMAHLDSAPASFAYRPGQVRNFRTSVYVSTGLISLGVIVPMIVGLGGSVDVVTRLVIVGLIIGAQLLASVDFWRLGYVPGANDNLSGVSAAVAAASHLWRHMPEDAEVRLVITSAEEAGMLGAQHYWQTHRDELKARDTYVVNLDTVGCENLKYIEKSGGFTPVNYANVLTNTAANICGVNESFAGIMPGTHRMGDFDSIWFVRDGINAITLASYDRFGLMTAIHTPGDTAEKIDHRTVEVAAKFAEAIVRMTPLRV